MKYNGDDMVEARENAGHTVVKASVIIDTSPTTIVNFEVRGDLPKSVHLQKALEAYITKHINK